MTSVHGICCSQQMTHEPDRARFVCHNCGTVETYQGRRHHPSGVDVYGSTGSATVELTLPRENGWVEHRCLTREHAWRLCHELRRVLSGDGT